MTPNLGQRGRNLTDKMVETKSEEENERIAKMALELRRPIILGYLPTESQLEEITSEDMNGFKQLPEGADLVYAIAARYIEIKPRKDGEYQFRTKEGDNFLERKGIKIKYK